MNDETQAPRRLGATWSAGDALLGIPIAAALLLIVVGPIVLILAGDSGLDFEIGGIAAQDGTLVAVAILFAIRRGADRPLAALGFRRPAPGWVWEVVIAVFVYAAYAISLTYLLGEPEQTDIPERLGVGESTLAAIAAGLMIVVVAPVTEETFFRGFFYGGLRSRLSFPVAALISAVLFGAVHMTEANLVAALQLVGFGALLAWLYEKTGSLWPPIALHVVNNAAAFALLVS